MFRMLRNLVEKCRKSEPKLVSLEVYDLGGNKHTVEVFDDDFIHTLAIKCLDPQQHVVVQILLDGNLVRCTYVHELIRRLTEDSFLQVICTHSSPIYDPHQAILADGCHTGKNFQSLVYRPHSNIAVDNRGSRIYFFTFDEETGSLALPAVFDTDQTIILKIVFSLDGTRMIRLTKTSGKFELFVTDTTSDNPTEWNDIVSLPIVEHLQNPICIVADPYNVRITLTHALGMLVWDDFRCVQTSHHSQNITIVPHPMVPNICFIVIDNTLSRWGIHESSCYIGTFKSTFPGYRVQTLGLFTLSQPLYEGPCCYFNARDFRFSRDGNKIFFYRETRSKLCQMCLRTGFSEHFSSPLHVKHISPDEQHYLLCGSDLEVQPLDLTSMKPVVVLNDPRAPINLSKDGHYSPRLFMTPCGRFVHMTCSRCQWF